MINSNNKFQSVLFIIGIMMLVGGIPSYAKARILQQEVVISDQVVEIEIDLNETTVRCLIGDYGMSSLKIVVPDIRLYTHLDHTSRGAPGPCINAGRCHSQTEDDWFFGGDDYRFPILRDPTKPTELIKLRVIKKEVSEVIDSNCVRSYVELISSRIRGIEFFHSASMPLATLTADKCQ